MQGDRELDKWIAENIFNNKYTPCIGEYGSEPYEDLYPNYTTDMNAAISALKKYEELKGYIVYPDLYSDNPARQVCEFIYSAETGEDWENK